MNENKQHMRNNIIQENKLPNSIILDIIQNKTSLGNNPALPDIYDTPFLQKIINVHYNELKNEINALDEFSNSTLNDLYSTLSKLISKCKKIETPYRNKLEKICYNFVVELFSIPEEIVNINIELKDNINFEKSKITIEPVDGNEKIEFNDLNDALSIKNEIYKRRLLIALSIGGAMEISKMINKYFHEISSINPDLCDLYYKILTLNEFLLFKKEDLEITDENKLQMGIVEVNLGNDEIKTTINAQGVIFPILLCELIRGFFELFISHGLPKNRQKTLEVLNKTDYLKSEIWDMRIGPSLWKLFSSSINNINSKELPYLLKRISSLDIKKFNFLMREIFAKTKKSKNIMSLLTKKAKNDMEYYHFANKMDKMKLDKSIITDEYIQYNEL